MRLEERRRLAASRRLRKAATKGCSLPFREAPCINTWRLSRPICVATSHTCGCASHPLQVATCLLQVATCTVLKAGFVGELGLIYRPSDSYL